MGSSMSMKWCKKNLEHFSQPVYDLMQTEYPDATMEIVECADVCGLCTDVPFAIRNNAVIGARDARGLYHKLRVGMGFLTAPVLPGTYAAAVAAKQQNSSTDMVKEK